jgi:hypothetical protein
MTHPFGCHSKTRTGIRPRRSASLVALKFKANVKIEIASAVIDNAAVRAMIDRPVADVDLGAYEAWSSSVKADVVNVDPRHG